MGYLTRLAKRTLLGMGLDVRRESPSSDVLREIDTLLRQCEEPVIFDVGAHFGETAWVFSRRFPKARIFSFEPFPESFEELAERCKKLPNVQVVKQGVSDETGTLVFHANAASATNSLLPLEAGADEAWNHSNLRPSRDVACSFTTLDAFLDKEGIECVDLLKLDVQGAEYKVLRGGARSLERGRVKNLYLEVIVQRTYAGQIRLGDYFNLIEDAGFRVRGLYDVVHGPRRDVMQMDILCCR